MVWPITNTPYTARTLHQFSEHLPLWQSRIFHARHKSLKQDPPNRVQIANQVVDAIVLSSTDAASQEAMVSSAQRVVVAHARSRRDAAVRHCLEYLDSEHPDFELEGSTRSVVQFVGVLPEAASCVVYAPIDLDGQVGTVIDVPSEVYELVRLAVHLAR